FILILSPHPTSTHFPYTTLFRSSVHKDHENLFFSDVQVRGKYPAYTKRFFKENNIHVEMAEGDEAILAAHPVDFMSFSYYMSSIDRKSTRLNSSHVSISYAVFCL